MLVPSCPTMHRARPTLLLLLPLLLIPGLFLHLADAQSKWTLGSHVGLQWVGACLSWLNIQTHKYFKKHRLMS